MSTELCGLNVGDGPGQEMSSGLCGGTRGARGGLHAEVRASLVVFPFSPSVLTPLRSLGFNELLFVNFLSMLEVHSVFLSLCSAQCFTPESAEFREVS